MRTIITNIANQLTKMTHHPDPTESNDGPPSETVEKLTALFNEGRTIEAALFARALVQQFPRHGIGWKALGVALQSQALNAEALAPMQRAAELLPADAEVHNNLSLVFVELHRLVEAEACCKLALRLIPGYAAAHYNLGNILRQQGRLAEAETSLRQALALNPGYAEACNNLGTLLKEQGRLAEAEACLRQALAIRPRHAKAHNNLGLVLMEQARLTEAEASLWRAMEITPDNAEAHNNLGVLFKTTGHLDKAEAALRRALQITPDHAETHCNLGAILNDLGRHGEGIDHCRRAVALKPDYAEAHTNLAYVLLSTGRLAEGFEQYDYRFLEKQGTPRRIFPQRHWAGQNLTDKALLIWGEQGVGDEIKYAGLFADAISQAGRCVIECNAKLVPLFVRSFPDAQVVVVSTPPHPATQQGIDYQCAAGSLPRWLRPTLGSFPRHRGYLTPNAQRVAFWKQRLASLGPGPKLGFSWRSSNLASNRRLYFSTLDQWGALFALPGVHFINLQYDECSVELREASSRFGVALHKFDDIDLFNDLDDSAALTLALDLVVSAPTTPSFLAGALGVPTWMMSYGGGAWETLGTEHLPWFPSIHLKMRRWDQSWEEVISDIAAGVSAQYLSS